MAAMAGSIISGVLQGTGGAGSEFAPIVKDKVDNVVSQRAETPDIKNADVKQAATEVPEQKETNWQDLAARANQMQQKQG